MQFFAIALLAVSTVSVSAAQQFGGADNLGPKIPTPQILVEKMLEAGDVKPEDTVYDLGSGDGRIVITAARKFGARGVGIEWDAELCRTARKRVKDLGLEDKVSIVEGNFLRADLSPATVVTMYLLTSSNERLRPTLEKHLKPGTRVVSNDYPIKGWKEKRLLLVKMGSTEHKIFVYVIGETK